MAAAELITGEASADTSAPGKLFVLVALVLSPVLAWLIGLTTPRADQIGGPLFFFAYPIGLPSLFTWLGGTLLRRERGEIALAALGSIFVSFGLFFLILVWANHAGAFDT